MKSNNNNKHINSFDKTIQSALSNVKGFDKKSFHDNQEQFSNFYSGRINLNEDNGIQKNLDTYFKLYFGGYEFSPSKCSILANDLAFIHIITLAQKGHNKAQWFLGAIFLDLYINEKNKQNKRLYLKAGVSCFRQCIRNNSSSVDDRCGAHSWLTEFKTHYYDNEKSISPIDLSLIDMPVYGASSSLRKALVDEDILNSIEITQIQEEAAAPNAWVSIPLLGTAQQSLPIKFTDYLILVNRFELAQAYLKRDKELNEYIKQIRLDLSSTKAIVNFLDRDDTEKNLKKNDAHRNLYTLLSLIGYTVARNKLIIFFSQKPKQSVDRVLGLKWLAEYVFSPIGINNNEKNQIRLLDCLMDNDFNTILSKDEIGEYVKFFQQSEHSGVKARLDDLSHVYPECFTDSNIKQGIHDNLKPKSQKQGYSYNDSKKDIDDNEQRRNKNEKIEGILTSLKDFLEKPVVNLSKSTFNETSKIEKTKMVSRINKLKFFSGAFGFYPGRIESEPNYDDLRSEMKRKSDADINVLSDKLKQLYLNEETEYRNALYKNCTEVMLPVLKKQRNAILGIKSTSKEAEALLQRFDDLAAKLLGDAFLRTITSNTSKAIIQYEFAPQKRHLFSTTYLENLALEVQQLLSEVKATKNRHESFDNLITLAHDVYLYGYYSKEKLGFLFGKYLSSQAIRTSENVILKHINDCELITNNSRHKVLSQEEIDNTAQEVARISISIFNVLKDCSRNATDQLEQNLQAKLDSVAQSASLVNEDASINKNINKALKNKLNALKEHQAVTTNNNTTTYEQRWRQVEAAYNELNTVLDAENQKYKNTAIEIEQKKQAELAKQQAEAQKQLDKERKQRERIEKDKIKHEKVEKLKKEARLIKEKELINESLILCEDKLKILQLFAQYSQVEEISPDTNNAHTAINNIIQQVKDIEQNFDSLPKEDINQQSMKACQLNKQAFDIIEALAKNTEAYLESQKDDRLKEVSDLAKRLQKDTKNNKKINKAISNLAKKLESINQMPITADSTYIQYANKWKKIEQAYANFMLILGNAKDEYVKKEAEEKGKQEEKNRKEQHKKLEQKRKMREAEAEKRAKLQQAIGVKISHFTKQIKELDFYTKQSRSLAMTVDTTTLETETAELNLLLSNYAAIEGIKELENLKQRMEKHIQNCREKCSFIRPLIHADIKGKLDKKIELYRQQQIIFDKIQSNKKDTSLHKPILHLLKIKTLNPDHLLTNICTLAIKEEDVGSFIGNVSQALDALTIGLQHEIIRLNNLIKEQEAEIEINTAKEELKQIGDELTQLLNQLPHEDEKVKALKQKLNEAFTLYQAAGTLDEVHLYKKQALEAKEVIHNKLKEHHRNKLNHTLEEITKTSIQTVVTLTGNSSHPAIEHIKQFRRETKLDLQSSEILDDKVVTLLKDNFEKVIKDDHLAPIYKEIDDQKQKLIGLKDKTIALLAEIAEDEEVKKVKQDISENMTNFLSPNTLVKAEQYKATLVQHYREIAEFVERKATAEFLATLATSEDQIKKDITNKLGGAPLQYDKTLEAIKKRYVVEKALTKQTHRQELLKRFAEDVHNDITSNLDEFITDINKRNQEQCDELSTTIDTLPPNDKRTIQLRKQLNELKNSDAKEPSVQFVADIADKIPLLQKQVKQTASEINSQNEEYANFSAYFSTARTEINKLIQTNSQLKEHTKAQQAIQPLIDGLNASIEGNTVAGLVTHYTNLLSNPNLIEKPDNSLANSFTRKVLIPFKKAIGRSNPNDQAILDRYEALKSANVIVDNLKVKLAEQQSQKTNNPQTKKANKPKQKTTLSNQLQILRVKTEAQPKQVKKPDIKTQQFEKQPQNHIASKGSFSPPVSLNNQDERLVNKFPGERLRDKIEILSTHIKNVLTDVDHLKKELLYRALIYQDKINGLSPSLEANERIKQYVKPLRNAVEQLKGLQIEITTSIHDPDISLSALLDYKNRSSDQLQKDKTNFDKHLGRLEEILEDINKIILEFNKFNQDNNKDLLAEIHNTLAYYKNEYQIKAEPRQIVTFAQNKR